MNGLAFFSEGTRVMALPGWHAPRLYLDADGDRRRASAFFPAFRPRAKLYRTALRAAATAGLFPTRPAEGASVPFADVLRAALPEAATWAVLRGTPGPAQKWTAEVRDAAGSIIGYAKWGQMEAAQARVRHEAAMLDALPPGLGPKRLALTAWHRGTLLVTTPVPGRPLPVAPSPPHDLAGFLHRLESETALPLDAHPWMEMLPEDAPADALDALAGRVWPVAIQHGDCAPWNLARAADGTLAAFDWEYGDLHGFPHLDLAYYVLQVGYHVEGWRPERAASEAAAVVQRAAEVTPDEARALVRLAAFDAAWKAAGEDPPLQRWRRAIWEQPASRTQFFDAVDVPEPTLPTERLRVLVSAYACEPGAGSEPGVGWNAAVELARHHDVWVLTRANNRPAVEVALAERPVAGLRFAYYDLPDWARWWKRGQRGVQLYYALWQRGALGVAQRLHAEVGFDAVHHLTLGKYWQPSHLWKLGVPFVLGPVGGGESAPRSFARTYGLRGRLYEMARDAARWLGERDPGVRAMVRHAALALAATPDTAARLRALRAERVAVVPGQTGLSLDDLRALDAAEPDGERPLRFVTLGRLLHWKGVHLALRAFAAADLPDAEYWIVGDGPERARLEDLAEALGVAERVRFCGRLPRAETLRVLSGSAALVHPALHDFSPTVVFEAMGAGKPVVALALGGPAVQVTPETGLAVPAPDPETAVAGLAEALRRLAGDAALREQMGRAARARAERLFTWPVKAALLGRLIGEAAGAASVSEPEAVLP